MTILLKLIDNIVRISSWIAGLASSSHISFLNYNQYIKQLKNDRGSY